MSGEPNPTAFLVKRLEAMRRKGEPDSELMKAYQAKLGLNNPALAELADVTIREVNRWRAGKPQPPQTLLLLLDAIGLAR